MNRTTPSRIAPGRLAPGRLAPGRLAPGRLLRTAARRPALLGIALALVACSQSSHPTTSRTSSTSASAAHTTTDQPAATPTAATPTRPTPIRSTSTAPTRTTATTRPSTRPAPTRTTPEQLSSAAPHGATGQVLPLHYATGDAQQVITVTAPFAASATASLQRWQHSSRGWTRIGPSVPAWLGAAGFSTPASETSTATPQGSYTLTRAFGRDADPGTALQYRQTTPADWWISQPGPLYNTLQHCSSGCSFRQGNPNEHLYYEIPYYEYAVVINYNASPVVAGRGSAFFLHVTVHAPTQGCVSIDRGQLVQVMRWLVPTEHPRILLGVG